MKLSILYSRKLANYLLLLVFLALLLKLVDRELPLLGIAGDQLVSTLLLILAGMLAVNILLCTWRRQLKQKAVLKYHGYLDLEMVDDLDVKLAALGLAEGRTIRTKGIPYASIGFHLSLLGILVGLLLSLLYGFYGRMYITEGQLVSQGPTAYTEKRKGPLGSWPAGNYQIAIGSTTVRHAPGIAEPLELSAQLLIMEQHSINANALISPNNSFSYAGLNFAYDDYGFAPRIMAYDEQGNLLLDAFINLFWSSQDDVLYVGEDSIDLGQDLNLKFKLYPDAKFTTDGKLTTLSNELLAPALWLTVTEKNKQVFSGPVILGQTARCTNGMKIAFQDVRKWIALLVKRDAGYYVMIASALAGAISLLLAVVFPPVKLELQGNKLSWATDKYPHLLVDKLKDKLGVD